MLTKDQLAKIAYQNHVGLGVQERDYIQHLFLSLLYTKTADFVFKGGTALRTAYNFARYSEDLDFNSNLSFDKAISILTGTVKQLVNFGVKAEFRRMKVFKENDKERSINGDISYEGPLFIGKSGSKGKVRIDVSLRGEKGEIKRVLVASKYDDISQYVLISFTLDEIFAEKMRALIIRGKPRDLYDVWVILESGIKINLPLINEKLSLYGKKFDLKEFKIKIAESKKEWKHDLGELLPQVSPFSEVQKAVILKFNKITA